MDAIFISWADFIKCDNWCAKHGSCNGLIFVLLISFFENMNRLLHSCKATKTSPVVNDLDLKYVLIILCCYARDILHIDNYNMKIYLQNKSTTGDKWQAATLLACLNKNDSNLFLNWVSKCGFFHHSWSPFPLLIAVPP